MSTPTPTCLLRYRLRLGDIVGCLPIARHLSRQGWKVDFACRAEYHGIFDAVTYCRPVLPEAWENSAYNRKYDLEIDRSTYDCYRASGKKWRDFVYGKYPEFLELAGTRPVFDAMPAPKDYDLPQRYALVNPFSISQNTRPHLEWFAAQCRSLSDLPWLYLAPRPARQRFPLGRPLTARHLADLPGLIAQAEVFITNNSSPNLIAAGVRASYYFVPEPTFQGQDNHEFSGQVIVPAPPDQLHFSPRYRFHEWKSRLTGFFENFR